MKSPKTDEREAFWAIATGTPTISPTLSTGQRHTLIADRNYFGHAFETELATAGIDLLRPARQGEKPRPGARFFKPLRQIIESVNDTLKGQLDLERHGGRSYTGVCARISQRVLAMTTAMWHNDKIGSRIRRSLTAYDH